MHGQNKAFSKTVSLDTMNAPSAAPPETRNPIAEEVAELRKPFQCPVRVAQTQLQQLPYTCTGLQGNNMAAVRRHLVRPLPRKKSPHLSFLKLCQTCNEDILDQSEFERFHGYDGEMCPNERKQRKGDAQQAQYDKLCQKIIDRLAKEGSAECMSTETWWL